MEQLKQLGYEITYSGLSGVVSYGKHMIHAKHSTGASVSGYGVDEAAAIQDAVTTLSKPK